MVDGFSTPKMTSKSWYKARYLEDSQSTMAKLPPLREETASRKPVNPLAISQHDTKQQILKLPPLVDASTFSELQRHRQQHQKKITATVRKKEKLIKNMYLPQVPLPPVSRVGYSHPSFYCATPKADFLLKSSLVCFSEHSGKTPRENAIYCLAVAR